MLIYCQFNHLCAPSHYRKQCWFIVNSTTCVHQAITGNNTDLLSIQPPVCTKPLPETMPIYCQFNHLCAPSHYRKQCWFIVNSTTCVHQAITGNNADLLSIQPPVCTNPLPETILIYCQFNHLCAPSHYRKQYWFIVNSTTCVHQAITGNNTDLLSIQPPVCTKPLPETILIYCQFNHLCAPIHYRKQCWFIINSTTCVHQAITGNNTDLLSIQPPVCTNPLPETILIYCQFNHLCAPSHYRKQYWFIVNSTTCVHQSITGNNTDLLSIQPPVCTKPLPETMLIYCQFNHLCAPSHYRKQCWFIVNSTTCVHQAITRTSANLLSIQPNLSKIQTFELKECIWNCHFWIEGMHLKLSFINL